MSELQDALDWWDAMVYPPRAETHYTTIVNAARRVANLDMEVAGEALRDGEEGAWELLTQATRDIWILQATLAVNAALDVTTEDDR